MRTVDRRRFETFGFDTETPWAEPALRLLFNVPRAYLPLVQAWDRRHPGTRTAIDRLTRAGFLAYQPGVTVDTRTGQLAGRAGPAVQRWKATAAGRRAFNEFSEDPRTVSDMFPQVTASQTVKVIRLLGSFVLDDSHARYGVSIPYAISSSGMNERLGRWWMQQFQNRKWVRNLGFKLGDTREIIPPHWRVTRVLARQLKSVATAHNRRELISEFRLNRRKFLADIDPARIGITGASDYDHDLETQRVIAALLSSEQWADNSVFSIEPRLLLPADTTVIPARFTTEGKSIVFYQPDGELRSASEQDGRWQVRRIVVEYERYQSRRDAWSHIERFVGYLTLHALPSENAMLCFVVDTPARARTYIELIEAFADYLIDWPGRRPTGPTVLAVATVSQVLSATDPLDVASWTRIDLPVRPVRADTSEGEPDGAVLHDPARSPYDAYFART